MTASDTFVYLEDFTDEVMPCRPELAAWAEWLAKSDPSWNRPEAAADGEEFAAYTMSLLGDVRVERVDGKWQAVEPVPEGTDQFYLRHHEGSEGWNAEFGGNDIENATDCLDCLDEDGPLWFACVKSGPSVRVRYEADGPRCVVVATVQ